MKYHYRIHKTKIGFWAECIEADGWVTQAKSRSELEKNMFEALNAVLDEPLESNWMPPLPNPSLKGRNIVEVPVEPHIALAMLVRQHRLKNKLTQKQAAAKLGMKHVYQYQKLESGKTANPELGTLVKLKGLFPNLSVDAALA
jgi:antitoxin HicB